MCALRHGNRKHLPIPKGKYPVGCVDIMTEYSPTGCFMRLFYPSAQEDLLVTERSMQWPLWLPTRKYAKGYARFIDMWTPLFRRLYSWLVGDIYIPALWDAPPIRGMKFPVLVFSHGLGGCRTTYSAICSDLASHGFIVAAVEHRDRSACYSYYFRDVNGRVSDDEDEAFSSCHSSLDGIAPSYVPEPVLYQKVYKHRKEYTVRNNQVHQRAQECMKALDVLKNINKGRSVHNVMDPTFTGNSFRNIMDVSRVGVVGHSFGGATVITTLANDKRYSVGVALDSWLFPLKNETQLFTAVKQPLMFINSETFQTSQNLLTMRKLESNTVERRMVTIKGSVHQNQSDIPFMSGVFARKLFGAASTINRFVALEINNKLMLTFLWRHLDVPPSPEYEKFLDAHCHLLIEDTMIDTMLNTQSNESSLDIEI